MTYRLSDKPDAVDFHFIKSSSFRVIHADGVWGGATPSRNIAICFYSERLPIPKVVRQSLKDGALAGELKRDILSGFVREIEVEVVMTPDAAVGIRDWLDKYIEELAT